MLYPAFNSSIFLLSYRYRSFSDYYSLYRLSLYLSVYLYVYPPFTSIHSTAFEQRFPLQSTFHFLTTYFASEFSTIIVSTAEVSVSKDLRLLSYDSPGENFGHKWFTHVSLLLICSSHKRSAMNLRFYI